MDIIIVIVVVIIIIIIIIIIISHTKIDDTRTLYILKVMVNK